MVIAPNSVRRGVVSGFVLDVGTALVPVVGIGVLFFGSGAGTMYRPATAPTLPAASASTLQWLGYGASGFYWASTPGGVGATDALVGWVLTDGSTVVQTSAQQFAVAADSGSGSTGGGVPSSSGAPPSLGTGMVGGIPFGYSTVSAVAGSVAVDLATGDNFRLTLGATAVTMAAPTWAYTIPFGSVIYVYLVSTSGCAAPVWTGGAGGYCSDTASRIAIDPTPGTETNVAIKFHSTGYWSVEYTDTGRATS